MGLDSQIAVPFLTTGTIGIMIEAVSPGGSEGMGIFRYWDTSDDTNLEINLWADWEDENHKLFGADILYYPLSHTGTNVDELYGEDQLEKFGTPKRIRALFNENEIAEPNRFFGAWGAMSDDVFTMTITKDQYSTKVDSTTNPAPGDIILTAWNNVHYEVTYVREDPGFTYVSNLWALILKRFEFAWQDGVSERVTSIDAADASAQALVVADVTTAGDEFWIEEASNTEVVDYDDDEALDDDIFGKF